MPGYSQRHPISTADLQQWEELALRFNHLPELLLLIYDIKADPTLFRLQQAAEVARYAASTAAEPAKTLAIRLAEELERRAAGADDVAPRPSAPCREQKRFVN